MSGLGPFYRRETGLSAQDGAHARVAKGQNLAIETALQLFRTSSRYEPLGVFVPWGKQTGAVSWETITRGDHDLILYPITDSDVRRVNAHSYGHELPWVGMLTTVPVMDQVADQVFDATRYDLFETEGVYHSDDGHTSPRIYFLYWAKLHPDVGGGKGSLDDVAKRLGGQLVFPLQTAQEPGRELPPLPFELVLGAQLAPPDPAVPAVQNTQDAQSGLGAEALPQSPAVPFGIWAAIAGATGYVFWRTVRPASPKRARR